MKNKALFESLEHDMPSLDSTDTNSFGDLIYRFIFSDGMTTTVTYQEGSWPSSLKDPITQAIAQRRTKQGDRK